MTSKTTFFSLVTIASLAFSPTITLSFAKKTADLVILLPVSGSAKTSGFPKSSNSAIAEKVVPKSIPTTLLMYYFTPF